MAESKDLGSSRYHALIERIFFGKNFCDYRPGKTRLSFSREDLPRAAKELGIELPKNLGDILYSVRYRTPLPESILETQPKGMEWIIEAEARSKYVFKLSKFSRIVPRQELVTIKIPDSTPEIIRGYALSDEQALLAIVRYNRLVDIFLGLTTYSLQNHLRSTLPNGSQIEIDELYIGLDTKGRHYAIPVQAKGGTDQISVVQTGQDVHWCMENMPNAVCRPVSAKFMTDERIAMFELTLRNEEVKVVDERHYQLVPFADEVE